MNCSIKNLKLRKGVGGARTWAKATTCQRKALLEKATYSPKDAIMEWNELTLGQQDDITKVLRKL